jgi:5-formyltetrahydrofolate cyclo-ligase
MARRESISPEQRDLAALSALPLLLNHAFFIQSQQIACYLSQDNEFNCMPFIEAVLTAKKNCFLPVLSEQKKQALQFAAYHPNTRLCLNRYNILEPEDKTFIAHEQLDLVLVPLVGFDLKGGRLGMGGGYYDRTFAFLNHHKTKKPRLIGLAYECQYVPDIPIEQHDVPLQAVITEKKWYNF